jgi:hypothetical protein
MAVGFVTKAKDTNDNKDGKDADKNDLMGCFWSVLSLGSVVSARQPLPIYMGYFPMSAGSSWSR